MGFILYLIPGIIAMGGATAYYFFKDRMIDKMLKIISVCFYAIAFLYALITATKLFITFMNNLASIMSGEYALNFPFKLLICVTIYIVTATALRTVSKKLEKKNSKKGGVKD